MDAYMNYVDQSRRSFLKIGSLLTVGIALTPAMALFLSHGNIPSLSDVSTEHNTLPTRSDIRSVDFDSHNFLLNFKR